MDQNHPDCEPTQGRSPAKAAGSLHQGSSDSPPKEKRALDLIVAMYHASGLHGAHLVPLEMVSALTASAFIHLCSVNAGLGLWIAMFRLGFHRYLYSLCPQKVQEVLSLSSFPDLQSNGLHEHASDASGGFVQDHAAGTSTEKKPIPETKRMNLNAVDSVMGSEFDTKLENELLTTSCPLLNAQFVLLRARSGSQQKFRDEGTGTAAGRSSTGQQASSDSCSLQDPVELLQLFLHALHQRLVVALGGPGGDDCTLVKEKPSRLGTSGTPAPGSRS
ncbi:hypothetical protein DNTS_005228 [Danionella cerebrum]|uniref:Uncharacterized protein n=1 Tax=Danionella cerebrum TaxID=2873325 RepID=A0A553QDE0_9TELE|nr:hypothetical protein DNTS_005228 [Danionella translucida]